MRQQYLGIALLVLAGCDGGSSSSNGNGPELSGAVSDSGDPSLPPVTMTGVANKGPFAAGSMVRIYDAGHTGEGESHQTSGTMGEFMVSVVPGEPYHMEVTGHYFSEHFGDLSGNELTLSAVIEGREGERANINMATHLAHQRILALVESGMSTGEAIDMAEVELVLAMTALMQAPAHGLRFSNLSVMNGAQETDNEEGNGWLLAMTTMVERAAVMASHLAGTDTESELTALCDRIADDFAEDGMIDEELMQQMLAARSEVDPDVVHRNLFEFDGRHRDDAIAAHAGMDRTDAMGYDCEVFGSEVLCADTGMPAMGSRRSVMHDLDDDGNTDRVSMALGHVVANMNRFMDSDGDGVVNADDDDDDNDGVPDEEDDTPYGH